jgi:hypothetical protein
LINPISRTWQSLTCHLIDEAISERIREQAGPIAEQVQSACHDALDFVQVPGFPSAIHLFALTHSRRNVGSTLAVAYLSLVRRTYRMSIESDIVERVNRAVSKKQIPISDQNDQNRF